MTNSSYETERRRRAPSKLRRVVDDWWFAVSCIALIIGSDYKLRTRSAGAAMGGGLDSAVMLELALYGLVGVFLVYSFNFWPTNRRLPVHLYLAVCFTGIVVLSTSYSPYVVYSVVRAGQLCLLLVLMLAAARHATRAHFHRFAHLYLLLVCASVFYGIARPSVAVNPRQVGRFTWMAIHPTVSGVITGLAVVVVVAYLCTGRAARPGPRWAVPVYVAILLIVGGAMLAAQTRGAIGGALAGVVVMLAARLGPRATIEFLAGLVVTVAAAALAFGGIITTYFVRGEEAAELTTLNSRTELWAVAFEAIGDRPLFGFGVTASRGIFYEQTGLGGGHNAVVNVLVELGLLGLIVWAATVVALIIGTVRLPRLVTNEFRLDRALLLGLVVFLLFDGFFYEGAGSVANVASTWLFVCIGWLAVLQRENRSLRASTQVLTSADDPYDSPAAQRTSG